MLPIPPCAQLLLRTLRNTKRLSDRGWTETVLHSYNGASDGDLLLAGVILDHEGNLYGTTTGGGLNGGGVVFEIMSGEEGPDD